jgi:ABC-type uncharacterized transport system substrate-binding protein
MATVPSVVGLTLTAALAAMVSAGLQTTLQQTYSSTVASGLVISQNPVAAATLPAGGAVIVVLSAGTVPLGGNGYDQWGTGGGGITAVNALPPLGQNLSDAVQPANAVYAANQSVMAALSNGNIPLSLATPAYQVPTTPKVG